MSSFYGGNSIFGTGKNTDYNNMANVPISNISGTEQNPIYFEVLDYGHYNLTGSFKILQDGQVFTINTPLDIMITKDAQTGDKIVTYETIESGKLKRTIIDYIGLHQAQIEKIDFNQSIMWSEF